MLSDLSMSNLGKIVAILFASAYIYFLVKLNNSFNRYRNLYQQKMNPKFAFSQKAIRREVETNPISFFMRAPLSPFVWWKTIFQSVSDTELKALQSKVRRYLLFLLLCSVCMVVAAALGFAVGFNEIG